MKSGRLLAAAPRGARRRPQRSRARRRVRDRGSGGARPAVRAARRCGPSLRRTDARERCRRRRRSRAGDVHHRVPERHEVSRWPAAQLAVRDRGQRRALLRARRDPPQARDDRDRRSARRGRRSQDPDLAKLPAAIAALPHDLRAALVLVDLEGERGRDAAATLGIPEGTLWRRVFTARKQLREALGGAA